MAVALYNGFPLVEGDTGSYIASGIEQSVPPDRTPFYGLFVRITSMWASLWLPIIAQCLLLTFVLRRFIRSFFTEALPSNILLLIVLLITSFTCVSWIAAFLMPDVFAGILLLSILLYLPNKKKNSFSGIVYLLIITLCIIIHNSHFLITAAFASLILVYALFTRNKILILRNTAMIAISVSFFFLVHFINDNNGNGFAFSKNSYQFMITKFAETGILKNYLDDNCDKKHFAICSFRNEIPPVSWEFLWSDYSPPYRAGGWEAHRAEYEYIIHDVFNTAKYRNLFIQKSFIYSLRQLVTFNVPDVCTFHGPDSQPYRYIKLYFEDEIGAYISAKQNNGGFHGETCNIFYYVYFALSVAMLLFLFPRLMTTEVKFTYACVLIFLLVNAFVSATFSTVINRFQSRVFWVLPALNTILIVKYLYYQYSAKLESPDTQKEIR
ncbi:MAG: hypothetical protein H7257_06505 [Taibaiella sp.]|nr:hypothetical protein [Taibaiella sp.]